MKFFLSRIIFTLFLTTTAAMAGAGDIHHPGHTADSLRIRIVTFGNSITATRKTIDKVFAQRIPDLLKSHGIVAEVINSGIPGSHTGSINDHNLFKIRHARDRFETDVLAHHPDLVTIGFGTNDAHIDSKVKGGPSRIPLDQFEKNLSYFIDKLKGAHSKIILITPNILGEKYGKLQNDRLLQYVKVMRKLAKKNKLGLVDNYRTFARQKKLGEDKLESLLLDGVHPNDAGHEIIARNLLDAILKIYDRNQQ